MSTVINGSFQQQDDVQDVLSALLGEGFGSGEIASFRIPVEPVPALDGDPMTPPETEAKGHDPAIDGALSGAAVGSAVGVAVGLVSLPVLGPGAALAGVGAGAYVGSLVGALSRLGDPEHPDTRDADAAVAEGGPAAAARQPGLLVAVEVREPGRRSAALRIFESHGARDLEAILGRIVDGQWVDFDATAALRPLAA